MSVTRRDSRWHLCDSKLAWKFRFPSILFVTLFRTIGNQMFLISRLSVLMVLGVKDMYATSFNLQYYNSSSIELLVVPMQSYDLVPEHVEPTSIYLFLLKINYGLKNIFCKLTWKLFLIFTKTATTCERGYVAYDCQDYADRCPLLL